MIHGSCDIFFLSSYCLIYSPIPTPCPAGTYGSVTGLQTAACSGLCDVGSYCLANSTTATPCPPGTYGFTKGLQTAACSGSCGAGSFCPMGSTAATTCPIGYDVHYNLSLLELHTMFSIYGLLICYLSSYCLIYSSAPIPCPAGSYGFVTGLKTAVCSGLCSAGIIQRVAQV